MRRAAGHAIFRLVDRMRVGQDARLTGIDWALACMALILLAWLNIGTASALVDKVPGYARWGLFCVWFLATTLRERDSLRRSASQLWPLAVVLAYIVFASVLGTHGLQPYEYGLAYLLAVYTLYLQYSRPRSRPIQYLLFCYLAADLVTVGVRTFLALDKNPMLSRFLATSSDTQRAVLGGAAYFGIGGYGFAYSIGAVALFLSYLLLNRPKRPYLCAGLLLACLVLLVKTAFMIAIILTVVIFVALLLQRFARTFGWRVSSVVALAVVATALTLGPPALRYASRLPGLSPMVSVRLGELARGVGGSDLGGTDLNARLSLYEDSLRAFEHTLPFGTSVRTHTNFAAGGHATWLDLMAVFGLLAALVFVFLLRAYRLTVQRLGPRSRSVVNAIWAYFVLLGMVNTLLFADLLTTWFFLLPTAAALFLRQPLPPDTGIDTGMTKPGPTGPSELAAAAGSGRVSGTRAAPAAGADRSDAGSVTTEGAVAKPKLLAIHHASGVGGGTRSLQDVLEMLHADYDVVVCCPADPPALASWLRANSYDYLPIELPLPLYNHYNGGSSLLSRTLWSGLWRSWRYRSAWIELVRSVAPDVVIVNSAVLAPLGAAIHAAGVRSVCFVRETFPPRVASARTRLLYRWLDRLFDGVIFLSEYDRRHAALKRASSIVVRDAVHLTNEQTVSRRDACTSLGVPCDSFNVLFVGGASRIKGLDVLLEAVPYLPPEIRVILAGALDAADSPGSARARLLSRLAGRRLGAFRKSIARSMEQGSVAARTVAVGIQSDMTLCYSAADVVVFPSTVPHQARPVFEAGAFGLPVVISDFEETAESVVDGRNGLTFPPGDARALARAIMKLYDDRQLTRRLGEDNLEATRTRHAFGVEREQLLAHINRMVHDASFAG